MPRSRRMWFEDLAGESRVWRLLADDYIEDLAGVICDLVGMFPLLVIAMTTMAAELLGRRFQ
jgi:hypothetical protein